MPPSAPSLISWRCGSDLKPGDRRRGERIVRSITCLICDRRSRNSEKLYSVPLLLFKERWLPQLLIKEHYSAFMCKRGEASKSKFLTSMGFNILFLKAPQNSAPYGFDLLSAVLFFYIQTNPAGKMGLCGHLTQQIRDLDKEQTDVDKGSLFFPYKSLMRMA